MMSASGDQNDRTVWTYRMRLRSWSMVSGMKRSAAALTAAEAELAMSDGSTDIGEGVGCSAPTHVALNVSPCVASDPIALSFVLEQAGDSGGEILGRVGEHDVVAVADGQPFDPDAGRDDSLAHGHGFVGFDACSASDAERNHEECAAGYVGADVFYSAEHANLRMDSSAVEQARRRISTHDRDVHGRDQGAQPRQHLVGEEDHTVLVGEPVHGAQED